MKQLVFGLLAVFFLLMGELSSTNATTPDSLQLIGFGGEGSLPSYIPLMKGSSTSSSTERIFGGDLDMGCPIDSLDALIISGSGFHNRLCLEALKAADPEAKVAFFPWDLYPAAAIAESLGIILVVPVSTSEAFGYGYVSQHKGTDFLLFVTMGQWNASDTERGYFPIPKGLGKYSICSTVADSLGNIIGSYGPTVEFPENWSTANLRSFVMSYLAGKFSFVRRRAQDIWNIKLTWQEVRQVCRMLAGPGAVDSLGRQESLCGVIDITPSKVDSALAEFQRQQMFAGVDCPKEVLPEQVTLHGNYPNPFNPFTTIAYTLARSGHIRVTIYNSLGQEIATLVDEDQTLGLHQVLWNAFNLPSGVYYYHLRGDGFYIVKPMTLLK